MAILNREIIIERIQKRQLILKNLAKHLKKHFVGIDIIIDDVIKNMRIWYITPELLSRPIIINLWGMTGVGKTDLVRKLIKYLKFENRFCEVELSTKGSSNRNWQTSIGAILDNNNILSKEPSILLLDEIQRFRTINDTGEEIHDGYYKDLWALLSDGKLTYEPNIDFLVSTIYEANLEKKKLNRNKPTAPPPINNEEDDSVEENDDDYRDSYYHIKRIKESLRLTDSLEEIASWDNGKILAIAKSKLKSGALYEHCDYSKLLIFISGNLDEAYKFSKGTDEVDIDADFFHKKSLKINILDIKNALLQRFRAEQIARFGNTHLIYPSLSRSNYRELIKRKIKEIQKRIKNNFEINIIVNESIRKLIYDNGVFPVQGTRPVFSTISGILENNLPNLLLNAFLDDKKNIKISYKNKELCAKIDNKFYSIPFEGVLDKIKHSNKDINKIAMVSTHEAGHALVYALLYKVAPAQLNSLIKNSYASGFMMECGEKIGNKQFILNDIAVGIAGKAAEEVVFGKNIVCIGSSADIENATAMAAAMVRVQGLGNNLSHIEPITSKEASMSNLDIDPTNNAIEALIKEAYIKAKQLITSPHNIKLYKAIVDELCNNYNISSLKFQKICKEHGLDIKIMKESDPKISPKYSEKLLNFLSEE